MTTILISAKYDTRDTLGHWTSQGDRLCDGVPPLDWHKNVQGNVLEPLRCLHQLSIQTPDIVEMGYTGRI